MAEITMKYAVVTGANRGIGFEVCRQLLSHGITVVLTARDEKRGLEAVERLNKLSYNNGGGVVIFHQLQVTDLASISSLAEFIKSRFGKLDILINNAGVLGGTLNDEVLKALGTEGAKAIDWNELTETYDLTAECVQTNYYGAKATTEALLPLLQLSDSPTIVNVSSTLGKLKHIPSHEWAKGTLNDAENLTEEKIEEVLNVFLNDFNNGSLEAKGWPLQTSAYIVSKAALNAYTRFIAKKYPGVRINCVCPGIVKTESNFNTGVLTVEEGAESLVRLALLPPSHDGPSGLFFDRKEVTSF